MAACLDCGCVVTPAQRRRCRDCKNRKARERVARWARDNPEKILAKRERAKAAGSRSKYDPAKARAYYLANKDRIQATTRKWQEANRERARELVRNWYSKNRDRAIELTRRWQRANYERVLANVKRRIHRLRAAHGEYTVAEIEAIYRAQKGRCAAEHGCGKKFARTKMEIDHIVPVSKGGCNFPFNLQLLCKSCNRRKHARLLTKKMSLFDTVMRR